MKRILLSTAILIVAALFMGQVRIPGPGGKQAAAATMVYVARGICHDDVNGTGCSQSTTVGATGSTMLALATIGVSESGVTCTLNGAAMTEVTWNGTDQFLSVGGIQGRAYFIANSSAGTFTGACTLTDGGQESTFLWIEIQNAKTTSPLDITIGATGSSTTPSSGASATLAQSNELAIGMYIMESNTATYGTWSNSFIDGQSNVWSFSQDGINEGHLVTSSTAAVTAAKTSAQNVNWIMGLITVKGL